MLLNIHDKNLNIIGILDNESQDAIGFKEDKWTRELETGSSVYEFTAYNRKLSYETVYTNPFNCLNVGNYVSFTYDGEDHVFKIMSVEKTGTETYCYCENLNLELRNEMIGPYDSGKEALSIEEHISKMALLNFTNMLVGLNELSNVGKAVKFDNEETKLSRLLALFKAFGAEHKFTTKLNSSGKVKEFRVDIYKKRESDGTGGVGKFVKDKILRKGENIKSLKEKQDILEIFNMTLPKGVKKVTRVTQEKKPTVNSNEVVVSSNMINASGTLSIENIQTILKLCYEYRVLPSGVISQLYLESFWGNSNVARVDNNWSGMTWTGNPNRPSGVVVSQGSARPSSEGGHYMHFANMSDFFKDYFYLLAKQGIYNVANKTNISDYTRGLFRVGGAAYDYAAAGYDHYNSLMTGIRNGINAKNGNVLDTYDNDWNNPRVVTSTTVEQPGAPNTKKALSELSSLVGRTVGNGQCYAVSAWFSYKLNGAGLGCGLGSFSGLVGSGIRACDIGTDYNWGSFGWGVEGSGFSGANIVAGTILNIKPNYGSPWYTGYYGHTVVVESVNGDTVTVLQQNYAGKQYVTRDKYSLSAIIPSIQTLVHPPELAKGGRVDGGNAVVKVDGVDRYVNVDLPTDVKTTEETEDFYIPEDYTREWYDENGNLEFYIEKSEIYAPQSANNFPIAFVSNDNRDRWIRRDFEYEVDSVEELIEKSLEDLKKNCYPTLDYEIDGFFEASIGDTYLIEDDDFEPKLTVKARVISQEISHTQPENNKTTLANYVKLKSAVPDALTSRLQQLIDASIPYEIRVTASNGTSFKNNEGESELTVELLKAGITQEAEFFFKNGDSIVGKGKTLLVKATDFEHVFNLTIEAYVNNALVATKPITFTDVEDGAQGIPGEPGTDGETSYIHFAYSDDDKGTNFSLTDKNQQYQGYYSDYTEADSTDHTKYKWVDRLANVKVDGVNKYIAKNSQAGYILNNETKENPNLGAADAITKEWTSEYIPVSSGQKITLQFWSTPTAGGAWNAYRFYSSNKTPLGTRVVHKNSNIGSLEYFSFTLNPPADAKFIRVSQSFFEDGKIMFEYSTVPSDYSPSPEDVQDDIDNKVATVKSEFEKTTDSIKASVTSLDKSTVKSSSLTINADGIVMKAGKSTSDFANAVGSYFSVNQNAINLFSDKINVKGSMIVNGAITSDKIASNSIDASKIAANSISSDKIVSSGITADVISGGVLKAANDAMQINLNSSNITFSEDASVIFTSSDNALKRVIAGKPSQFIKMCDSVFVSEIGELPDSTITVIASNSDKTEDIDSPGFGGVKIWNGSSSTDSTSFVELVGNRVAIYGNKNRSPWLFDMTTTTSSLIPQNSNGIKHSLGRGDRPFHSVYADNMYIQGERVAMMLKDIALHIGYKGNNGWVDRIS